MLDVTIKHDSNNVCFTAEPSSMALVNALSIVDYPQFSAQTGLILVQCA